jgi:hypothetical protein
MAEPVVSSESDSDEEIGHADVIILSDIKTAEVCMEKRVRANEKNPTVNWL